MLWFLFVFLSYQDRHVVKGKLLNDAQGTENESKDAWFTVNRTLCAKMSVLAGGLDSLYQVSDGRREVRSIVNTRGDLVDCSVIVDRVQVKSFLHLCRLGLTQQEFHSEHLRANNRFVRMEEALAACRHFTQRSERAELSARKATTQPWPSRGAPLRRSKRGFTYPGTLWCGAGNTADHYDQLGDFAEVDSCCRTHDHCPRVIQAFSSNYGYTNFKWHSISHCDCDIAMKECLTKVNDTASRVVGQAFFNVIGAPCFEFVYTDHCVERHWYGVCKRYEKLPVAVPRPAIPYVFGGVDIIDVLTLAPPAKTNAAEVSPTGGPGAAGEASLVTMVTAAAEDFVKVLATVSTSQSSPPDGAEGATLTAGKTKKKKKTKKTKKKDGKNWNNSGKSRSRSRGKPKGKGRGRKLKLHEDAGVEDIPAPSSNIFLQTGRSGHKNQNRFGEGGSDLAGRGVASNDVMKDEPVGEEDTAEVTTSSAASPKEQVTQPTDRATPGTGSARGRLPGTTGPTAATQRKTHTSRSRKGERRRAKPPKRDGYSPRDYEVHLVNMSAPRLVGANPPAHTGHERPEGLSESVLTTAGTHVVMNRTGRIRSGEGTAGKAPKKRRKLKAAVPIVSLDHKVPRGSEEVMSSVGTSVASSIPRTKRPEVHSSSSVTPAPSPSLVHTKGQRLKGTGLQRRRGKSRLSAFIENPILASTLVVPTSSSVFSRKSSTTPSPVVTRPCGAVERSPKRGPQRAKTRARAHSAARQRPTRRKGLRTRKKTLLCVLGGEESPRPRAATHGPGTLPAFNISSVPKQERSPQSSLVTSSRAAVFGPMQLSIQRAKEQFHFKKKRKQRPQ